jgi:hypothetical protein
MAYQSLGKFKCDGCRVIESGDIELPADNLQAMTPPSWLRVETTQRRADLDIIAVAHYCPSCAPLIQSYLQGRQP